MVLGSCVGLGAWRAGRRPKTELNLVWLFKNLVSPKYPVLLLSSLLPMMRSIYGDTEKGLGFLTGVEGVRILFWCFLFLWTQSDDV